MLAENGVQSTKFSSHNFGLLGSHSEEKLLTFKYCDFWYFSLFMSRGQCDDQYSFMTSFLRFLVKSRLMHPFLQSIWSHLVRLSCVFVRLFAMFTSALIVLCIRIKYKGAPKVMVLESQRPP